MKIVRLLALPLAVLAAGCEPGTGPVRPIDALPRSLSTAEREVISSSNDFAFHLFREVNSSHSASNVFISPLSVSMALGMTMNGAAGQTYDEMRSTLGFGRLSEEEINASYRSLLSLLVGLDPVVQIGVANSIWYRRGFDFEEPFFNRVRTNFAAEVNALDFDDPKSVEPVNAWARKQTNGRIDSILKSIDPRDVMYLINAVYFNGSWTTSFPKDRTVQDQFWTPDGGRMGIRMMNTEGPFRSRSTLAYEAVELPYGGGAFVMSIILPSGAPRDIDAFVAGLDAARWQEVVDGLVEQQLTVSMPRFRMEYDSELEDALSALSMPTAFAGGSADFTRMSASAGRDLFVSSVKHSTFVDVHEEGTEAAAVTKVTIGLVSAKPGVRIDRPFVFAIRERHSGTILFTGKIVSPTVD